MSIRGTCLSTEGPVCVDSWYMSFNRGSCLCRLMVRVTMRWPTCDDLEDGQNSNNSERSV